MKFLIEPDLPFKAYETKEPDHVLVQATSDTEEILVLFDTSTTKPLWAVYNKAYGEYWKCKGSPREEIETFLSSHDWNAQKFTIDPNPFLKIIFSHLWWNSARFLTTTTLESGNNMISEVQGVYMEWAIVTDRNENVVDRVGSLFKILYAYTALNMGQ